MTKEAVNTVLAKEIISFKAKSPIITRGEVPPYLLTQQGLDDQDRGALKGAAQKAHEFYESNLGHPLDFPDLLDDSFALFGRVIHTYLDRQYPNPASPEDAGKA